MKDFRKFYQEKNGEFQLFWADGGERVQDLIIRLCETVADYLDELKKEIEKEK